MIQWPELYEMGFSVFPLKPRDKRPLGSWEKYQHERANDEELALWRQRADLNGAIATGEISGIFVVDLDSDEAAKAFFARGVPETPRVKTGKGRHVYFRHPGFPVKNSAGKIGKGIDVRGDGGYVCAPGSIHPSGATYEWERSPDDTPLAQAPDWLINELTKPQPPNTITPVEAESSDDKAGSLATTPDANPAVEAWFDAEVAKLRKAGEGGRNNALNIAAMRFGQIVAGGHISESYATLRLLSEAVYAGLSEREARSTIASGLKKGKTEARRIAEPATKPNAGEPADWLHDGISAAELQQKTFEPIRWVVPGFIVEGTTLLGARPKRGKSWLMLGCALGVGAGEYALGARCEEGDVLGLFLEDNRRRLNSRMAMLLGDKPWPARVKLYTLENGWPRFDEGGLERIDRWIESVERPRLVVVDVLTKVRPRGDKNRSPYENDYEALKGLTELAAKRRVAIVAVHHCRKSPSDEDPFDELSGTTGLTGAANTTLVLKRGDAKADLLYGRGHDVPEFEKALAFDKTRGLWSVLGDAEEFRGTETEAKIRAALEASPTPLSPKQLHTEVDNVSDESLKKRLARMIRAGTVRKDERGKYASA